MKKIFTIFIVCCSLLFTVLVTTCESGANLKTHSTGGQVPTKSPTNTTSGLGHLLQQSKTAMANLQSFHFELDAIRKSEPGFGSASGIANSVADLSQAFQMLPSGILDIETKGTGDMVAPGLSQISLVTIVKQASPGRFTRHNFMQQDNVYLPGADNNWYVISKKNLLATIHSDVYSEDGLSQVNALIDLALQKGTLHDDGTGTVAGKQLHHIQVIFQLDAFQDLQNIDIDNANPQSNLSLVKNITATTDFWIDDSTGRIYQVLNTVKLDPVRTQTLSFQYSVFNQPITIQLPTHPIPISNVNQIPASMDINY